MKRIRLRRPTTPFKLALMISNKHIRALVFHRETNEHLLSIGTTDKEVRELIREKKEATGNAKDGLPKHVANTDALDAVSVVLTRRAKELNMEHFELAHRFKATSLPRRFLYNVRSSGIKTQKTIRDPNDWIWVNPMPFFKRVLRGEAVGASRERSTGQEAVPLESQSTN
ncbi:hypothetical protein NDN08_002020 [Rhodosorus marinus]|uniref:Uncharacterized protein n=1 Tax=Rhodosorus marinus TaxID=101924 RepID=A0AAV8UWN9_9RHOD|nr:hypothetical protein NDN08_002020 [Rhodosorus marinus]